MCASALTEPTADPARDAWEIQADTAGSPPARPATPLDRPSSHYLATSHVIANTFTKNYGDDSE